MTIILDWQEIFMICLENTPNYAGVYLSGDVHDLSMLHASLLTIIGEEGEYAGYDQLRHRVLRLCSDLEDAMVGQGEMVFVPNGIDRETISSITLSEVSESNVNFQMKVLWPELLFVGFVLNDYVELAAKHKAHYWDPIHANVRQFQSLIGECLEKTIGWDKFRLIKSYLTPTFIGYYQNYVTQYIDYLTNKFLRMNSEKRLANISIAAKRIADKGDSYMRIKRKVEIASIQQGIEWKEVIIVENNIEEIEW
ncbi:hypothetical protein SLU01_07310 [Sporosarcina luteola]|uniref:Uncharacterized protein n=1 Tax=Sporosarcina luteola TaxID=582850 RepID=A0A511Z4Q3_9BACL|nr:hypothetical protein [Sporosarcina luteola]GEN82419.1 hypothetical protein SLU01_07310 [Sporosarcina luteola]